MPEDSVFINWITLGSEWFLMKRRFPKFAQIEQTILSSKKQDRDEWVRRKTGEITNPSGKDLKAPALSSLMSFDELQETSTIEVAPLQLYYGVFNLRGLEALMSEELWENDDHEAHAGNFRGGGKKFWLNWCQNGGRDGSSMPFSVWLHPEDFQYIKSNPEAMTLLQLLFQLDIGPDQTMLSYLWPWNQHWSVIKQNIDSRIEDEAADGDERNEIASQEMVDYANKNAQTRGPRIGYIYPLPEAL